MQDGDGRQSNKLPDQALTIIVGRTWPCYLYHNTAAATWTVIRASVCLLPGISLFPPGSSSYSVYMRLALFKCLPHPLQVGTTFFFFPFSLSICFLFFFFLLLSPFHRMCLSCLSYPASIMNMASHSTLLTAYLVTMYQVVRVSLM